MGGIFQNRITTHILITPIRITLQISYDHYDKRFPNHSIVSGTEREATKQKTQVDNSQTTKANIIMAVAWRY